MFVYGNCECFVQMLYVCVLCTSCGSSQCCILHDLQFVNAGRGCKRRPYGISILQSQSHDCLVGSHECCCLPFETCQFHHRRLESLEHLNVLFISLLALRSHFFYLKDDILFLQGLQ